MEHRFSRVCDATLWRCLHSAEYERLRLCLRLFGVTSPNNRLNHAGFFDDDVMRVCFATAARLLLPALFCLLFRCSITLTLILVQTTTVGLVTLMRGGRLTALCGVFCCRVMRKVSGPRRFAVGSPDLFMDGYVAVTTGRPTTAHACLNVWTAPNSY